MPGGYYLQNGWEQQGCINFEQDNFYADPMGRIHFEWHVTKNNSTQIFHDTISLEEGEQRLYEIIY